jgi:hypothetical protein
MIVQVKEIYIKEKNFEDIQKGYTIAIDVNTD